MEGTQYMKGTQELTPTVLLGVALKLNSVVVPNRKSESWIKAETLASSGNARDLGFAVPRIALLIIDP
ncbi:unnamed protein product [Sphenostylis stenocarpa]|uniref:Uncharacterized protein n=1 Tax=Sphenostylis stenocarpa TaxID=92480 RepID=A0AA86V1H8_9FABA|nr:unnamed protein product [Sphenostylis stenocarpa]